MLPNHKKFINSVIKEASDIGMNPYAPEDIGFNYSDGYEPVAVDNTDHETELDKQMADDTTVAAILDQIRINFQYVSEEVLSRFVGIPQNPEFQTVGFIANVPSKTMTINIVLDEIDNNHVQTSLSDFIKIFEKTLNSKMKSRLAVESDVKTQSLGGPTFNKLETTVVVTVLKADVADVPDLNADEFLKNYGRSTPRTKDDK